MIVPKSADEGIPISLGSQRTSDLRRGSVFMDPQGYVVRQAIMAIRTTLRYLGVNEVHLHSLFQSSYLRRRWMSFSCSRLGLCYTATRNMNLHCRSWSPRRSVPPARMTYRKWYKSDVRLAEDLAVGFLPLSSPWSGGDQLESRSWKQEGVISKRRGLTCASPFACSGIMCVQWNRGVFQSFTYDPI